MTDASFAAWLHEQVTLGNLSAFVTTLVAFGYQLRRLQDIERDIADVRNAQRAAVADAAATYTRRDVLAETLQSMNARLANIEADVRDVKHNALPIVRRQS